MRKETTIGIIVVSLTLLCFVIFIYIVASPGKQDANTSIAEPNVKPDGWLTWNDANECLMISIDGNDVPIKEAIKRVVEPNIIPIPMTNPSFTITGMAYEIVEREPNLIIVTKTWTDHPLGIDNYDNMIWEVLYKITIKPPYLILTEESDCFEVQHNYLEVIEGKTK